MIPGGKMNTLGIIGGVGPLATAYFLDMLVRMTDAQTDQQHPDMIIYNAPSIPDRTSYILGKSDESPVPRVIEIAKKLEDQGVSHIAAPCVTLHRFHDEISGALSVPLINAVAETDEYLASHGIETAGIMATDGSVRGGVFKKYFKKTKCIYPSKMSQELVMEIIYGSVKSGRPVDMHRFCAIADELRSEGAQCIVLGCTELSIVRRDYDIGAGFLDAMEVLACASLRACGAPVKKEYEELITTDVHRA